METAEYVSFRNFLSAFRPLFARCYCQNSECTKRYETLNIVLRYYFWNNQEALRHISHIERISNNFLFIFLFTFFSMELYTSVCLYAKRRIVRGKAIHNYLKVKFHRATRISPSCINIQGQAFEFLLPLLFANLSRIIRSNLQIYLSPR